jgi:uncharacterized membrane protein
MESVNQIVLLAHIGGGSLAILSGFAALFSGKGNYIHRAAGKVFSVSMIVMAIGASYLGYAHADVNDIIAGMTTIYLIATAWMAVKRRDGQIGFFEPAAFLVALAGVAANLEFAYLAANSETGLLYGVPAKQYHIVSAILGLAAVLDLSVLLRRGLSGKERIARHLWRMCLALFIAVGSLFLGQMQFFPEAIRHIEILATPVVVALAMMGYWIIRVLFTGWYKRKQDASVSDVRTRHFRLD